MSGHVKTAVLERGSFSSDSVHSEVVCLSLHPL